MFSFIKHVVRNKAFTIKKARRLYATRKAMKAYAEAHPRCAWCGRDKDVDVHHRVPISVNPDLAGNPDNMISLCADRCHLYVGHNGDYRNRFESNLLQLIEQRRVVHTEAAQ